MSSLLRVWQEVHLGDLKKHLLVAGELTGQCLNCHKLGINLAAKFCPGCGVEFKFMGFRRKINLSSLARLKKKYAQMTFIDFDDFKKALAKIDARKILNI
ncbi:MAG: hypothetical protein KAS99_00755 [Candidatus Omnitrophica bacterium]|nr:hypothetical protein [Candidatus Omnitrophota bacterium]